MDGKESEIKASHYLRLETHSRTIKTIVWVSLLLFPIVYAGYNLAPYFTKDTFVQAISSDEYTKAGSLLSESLLNKGEKQHSYFRYKSSELVEVIIPITVAPTDQGKVVVTPDVPEFVLRYDRLILFGGGWLIVILAFRTVLSNVSRLSVGPFEVSIENTDATRISSGSPAPHTAIELFEMEVKSSERRAESLFERSTLMLAGGIIMAFIGVAIFYVTLPDPPISPESAYLTGPTSQPNGLSDDKLKWYLLRAIRPAGVLIFVEAIAWFLLRQYRALIEDYKSFHRLYMKRANYLAALRILDKQTIRPEDIYIAASLVEEDLSGKLRKGETTESLENLKNTGDSPITEILNAISSLNGRKAKQGTTEKGKVSEE
jgi:hypothetical protein